MNKFLLSTFLSYFMSNIRGGGLKMQKMVCAGVSRPQKFLMMFQSVPKLIAT